MMKGSHVHLTACAQMAQVSESGIALPCLAGCAQELVWEIVDSGVCGMMQGEREILGTLALEVSAAL